MFVIDAMFGKGIVLDAKPSLFLGSAMGAKARFYPIAIAMVGMAARIVHTATAYAAHAGYGFFESLEQLFLVGEENLRAEAEGKVHQFGLDKTFGGKDEHLLVEPSHQAGFHVRGLSAGKQQDAGIGSLQCYVVVPEPFQGIPVFQHLGEVIGRNLRNPLVLLEVPDARCDGLPHVAVLAPHGVAEVVDLMPSLS